MTRWSPPPYCMTSVTAALGDPAKDPGATTHHFDHFRRLLVGLVRPGVKK
jgi:hypothetical protein